MERTEARAFLDANPEVGAIELLITDPGGVPRGKLIAREELLSLVLRRTLRRRLDSRP